ncbi:MULTISPECIES: folate-binding protein YgfZ [unclassified Uliginosibacterium]|uniref:CAF17-like 4Fe-4S cluster assembly/insertion protein YgfZ n=1 Tax=unclassified Uliginosibacterium TaxID=2621521 RepID=UPI000C7D07A6|nr:MULTISPECIES: folate-binding protein YgfZ [unclassified Uliginosibacterium]MDO6385209.1 folate-binding protein YgfZ [Uliginosibacterium sp. 31-12]PLK47701.1 folate-binding protein [Uliginosibacterium sp. TH139]
MTSEWQAFLQTQGASFDAAYVSFLPARDETALAANDTVLTPLSHLGLISATGEESASFLHNLGSNDVKKLPPGRAQHNSLNSPKGRMLASFIAWHSTDGYLLALSADLHASILKKLSMYVLRAKVKLADASSERVLLGLAGTGAGAALAAAGLAEPSNALDVSQGEARVIHLDGSRYIIDCPAQNVEKLWQALTGAGAKPAGTAAWRWLDIQAGLPLITSKTQDEFVAQMLNFELLGGVNFQKGCYPGQEIVARTQYLGKLKKRMYRAHLASADNADIGNDLYAPEFGAQSCGKLVALEPSPVAGVDLLAVMQISAFEAGEVHLGAPDGPLLSLAPLPYSID